jgi:hypothetical protein
MDDDEKKDVDQKKEAFDQGHSELSKPDLSPSPVELPQKAAEEPSPPPVEAPKKARKAPAAKRAPKKAPVEAAVEPPRLAPASPRLQPMFFVELGTTLKQMRHAERAHRISSLKIA